MRSHMKSNLKGVHVLGSPWYTPAYITAAGVRVSSRLVVNVRGNETINGKNRTTDMQLTMWSAGKAEPGKGFAEKMARLLHVGKELDTFGAQMRDYMHTVKTREGVVCVNADGSPIQLKLSTLVVDNSETYPGADATKVCQNEIANYLAMGAGRPASEYGFKARPQFWNVAGHADAIVWKAIQEYRSSLLPDLAAKQYGYATIGSIPAGCTPIGVAVAGAADVAAAAEIGAALPADVAGDDFPGDAELEAIAGEDAPF